MRSFLKFSSLAGAVLAVPWTDSSAGSNHFDLNLRAANNSNAPQTVNMVSASWFAGWHAVKTVSPIFAVSNVSWSKYTSVVYSFAVSSDDDAHFQLADADVPILKQFVKAAKQNQVEPRLALGGWGGSQFFSYAFSPANRSATIKTILNLASTYGLGGFDFDWEYPGRQGIGCNIVSPDDTANFLTTLQAIRKTAAGANLTLSAAVVSPFADSTGNPSTDVSGFANVLDYVEIMNYDIWGNWSSSLGPNAPLNDTCVSNPDNQQGSAVTFVNQWVKANFPKYKIVLGLASYGHTFAVPASEIHDAQTLAEYPAFNQGASQGAKFGDSWGSQASVDQCGAIVPAGGDMNYWGLKQQGFLYANGSAKAGILHAFDDCAQTDYVYNPKSGVAVSYDSPRAFTAKGDFIKTEGLRGFSIWETGGDSDDQLLDAVRQATGWEDPDNSDNGDDNCDESKSETGTSKVAVVVPGHTNPSSSKPCAKKEPTVNTNPSSSSNTSDTPAPGGGLAGSAITSSPLSILLTSTFPFFMTTLALL